MEIPFQTNGGSNSTRLYLNPQQQQQHQQQRPPPPFHFPPSSLPPPTRSRAAVFGAPNTSFGSGIEPSFGSTTNSPFGFSARPNSNSRTSTSSTHSLPSTNSNNYARNINTRHSYGTHLGQFQNMTTPGFQSQHNKSSQQASRNPTGSQALPYPNNGNGSLPTIGSSIIPPAPTAAPGLTTSSTTASNVKGVATGITEMKIDESGPQYRIFKRGDSIPGISCPTSVLSPLDLESSQGQAVVGSGLDGTLGAENIRGATVGGAAGGSTGTRVLTSQKGSMRTAVSLIGEIAKFHGLGVEYHLVKEIGPPHAPTFTVVLKLGAEEYEGTGASIKKAQLAAATEAWNKTSFSRPPPRTQPKRPYTHHPHPQPKGANWPLLQLTSLAEELKEPLSFVNQPVTIVDPFRKGDPPSRMAVHVGDRIFIGEGNGFNTAKNLAVMIALKALVQVKQEQELGKLSGEGGVLEGLEDENKSPISVVHEMAMKRSLSVSFEVTKEAGPPHMKLFTVQCSVGELRSEAEGATKQLAKKLASEEMIVRLKEIPPSSVPNGLGPVNSIKFIQRGLLKSRVSKRKPTTPVVKDMENQIVSPISRLIQIAHIRKYKEPEFVVVQAGEIPEIPVVVPEPSSKYSNRRVFKRKPLFIIEVKVGPHVARGEGVNKKAAKKGAADNALILLGYPPSEPTTTASTTTNKEAQAKALTSSSPELNIVSARQIVPGLLVVSSAETGGSTTSAAPVVAQETMVKVNSLPILGASPHEGVNKLSYLSHLLEVGVSYSDFPKKNEFLCVVSLGTNPPHVAHGIGSTLEEARNTAALKMLDELSQIGLDNVRTQQPEPLSSSSSQVTTTTGPTQPAPLLVAPHI